MAGSGSSGTVECMRVRVVTAAALVLVTIAGVLLAVSGSQEPEKVIAPTVRLDTAALAVQLRSCAQEPEESKGVCQLEAMDAAGLGTMDAIGALVASVQDPSACHSGAHDLGQRLWNSEKIIIATGIPVEACDYGVVHGAMSSAATTLNVVDLVALIDSTCGSDDRACWHGAGHAFTDVYADPAEMMRACSTTSQPRMCVGGAAMELALRRDGTTYEICSTLKGTEQFECDFQVAYSFGSIRLQTEQYISDCLDVRRPGCAVGSGWAGTTYDGTRLESADMYCGPYGDLSDACTGGVLMAQRSITPDADIVSLCREAFTSGKCNSIFKILSTWYE